MDGIMMRGPVTTAMAVRNTKGEIVIEKFPTVTKQRSKFFSLPIIRGVVGYIDSMTVGTKCLTRSAEISGLEEAEEELRLEKEAKKAAKAAKKAAKAAKKSGIVEELTAEENSDTPIAPKSESITESMFEESTESINVIEEAELESDKKRSVSNDKSSNNIDVSAVSLICQKSIVSSIILSALTLGIYNIFWMYSIIKSACILQNNSKSVVKQFLLYVFVPFYHIYWWYKNGEQLEREYKKFNYRPIGHRVAYLLLSLFCLNIIAMAILQSDFNALKAKYISSSKKKKPSMLDGLMPIITIFAMLIAIVLFILVPTWLFNGATQIEVFSFLKSDNVITQSLIKSLFESSLRVIFLVAYMSLMLLMKEIRRTFRYHGAEHKTIFCYEAGLELTVENVRKQKKQHPRCGTSFLILMVLVSFFISFWIDPIFYLIFQAETPLIVRTCIKILMLPLICGVGYELIKLAGKYDNWLTKLISLPGVWFQHITVLEPDDSMIECAIAAMKEVIPEDHSDEI